MSASSSAQASVSAGALTSLGALGPALGFTEANIRVLEAMAVSLMRERKLERAEDCLRLACLLDHANPGLWVRLGDCQRLRKNFGAALTSYGLAAEVGVPPAAWFFIKMAVCRLALGEAEKAFELLGEAETLAERPDADASAQQFLSALLASVKGTASGKSEP